MKMEALAGDCVVDSGYFGELGKGRGEHEHGLAGRRGWSRSGQGRSLD